MRIVVLVGLPGSGKSTHLERLGVNGLSSDKIRGLLADDERDQTIHERVFQTVRYLLRQRLAIGRPVTDIVVDNGPSQIFKIHSGEITLMQPLIRVATQMLPAASTARLSKR